MSCVCISLNKKKFKKYYAKVYGKDHLKVIVTPWKVLHFALTQIKCLGIFVGTDYSKCESKNLEMKITKAEHLLSGVVENLHFMTNQKFPYIKINIQFLYTVQPRVWLISLVYKVRHSIRN